jgi:hypothetical protein
MIIQNSSGLRLVTQSDHAHLANRIVALWRADGLPEHPRRDEILFAAREHDCGWQVEDAAPRIEPETGRPYDFRNFPAAPRLEVWDRSTGEHQDDHPVSALLVTHHALYLYERYRDPAARPEGDLELWDTFFALLDARADDLHEATGLTRDEALADYRFLHLADLAALMLSLGTEWGTEPVERMGLRLALSDDATTLHLDPLPLAGATSFRLACRHVPDREYSGTKDIVEEMIAARWESLPVRLAPWP